MAAVCARFRDIVVSHAPFWTDIYNDLREEEVMMFLSRSKSAPLSIFLHDRRSRDNVLFLRILYAHRHRWHFLMIDYSNHKRDPGCLSSAVQDVFRVLRGLLLPTLSILSIHVPVLNLSTEYDEPPEYTDSDDSEDHEEPPFNRNQFHTYVTWRAPMLRELHASSIIPSAHATFKLTKCYLDYSSWNWDCPADPLKDLMALLKAQSSLELLDITMLQFADSTKYPIGAVVQLPRLRQLRLSVEYDHNKAMLDLSAAVAPIILQSLEVPALEELYASIPIANDFQLTSIFPRSNDYASLQELTLVLFREDESSELDVTLTPFKDIFERMHSLEHLQVSVTSNGISVLGTIPSYLSTPPPLRTLRLVECPGLTEDSLHAIIQYLVDGPHWDKFEKLEIKDCKELLHCVEVLSEFLPPEKIALDIWDPVLY